jgi:hypothetical protein
MGIDLSKIPAALLPGLMHERQTLVDTTSVAISLPDDMEKYISSWRQAAAQIWNANYGSRGLLPQSLAGADTLEHRISHLQSCPSEATCMLATPSFSLS